MNQKNKKEIIPPAFKKDYKGFQTWNTMTAECFMNKMNCHKCCNREDCKIEVIHKNPYNIQNIKYATLMTYSNIGLNGIELYYTKMAKN